MPIYQNYFPSLCLAYHSSDNEGSWLAPSCVGPRDGPTHEESSDHPLSSLSIHHFGKSVGGGEDGDRWLMERERRGDPTAPRALNREGANPLPIMNLFYLCILWFICTKDERQSVNLHLSSMASCRFLQWSLPQTSICSQASLCWGHCNFEQRQRHSQFLVEKKNAPDYPHLQEFWKIDTPLDVYNFIMKLFQ